MEILQEIFFNNIEEVADISKLDKTLLYQIAIILKTINSGCEINITKFEAYCRNTAELFVK